MTGCVLYFLKGRGMGEGANISRLPRIEGEAIVRKEKYIAKYCRDAFVGISANRIKESINGKIYPSVCFYLENYGEFEKVIQICTRILKSYSKCKINVSLNLSSLIKEYNFLLNYLYMYMYIKYTFLD